MTELEREIRACTRDLGRREILLRTCPCGRVCRTGETFVRHRERCRVPFPPEEPGVEEQWREFGARVGRTLRRLMDEHPPRTMLRGHMLLGRLDQFCGTLEEIRRECEVQDGLEGFDAELIRLQYEVPPNG